MELAPEFTFEAMPSEPLKPGAGPFGIGGGVMYEVYRAA